MKILDLMLTGDGAGKVRKLVKKLFYTRRPFQISWNKKFKQIQMHVKQSKFNFTVHGMHLGASERI